MEPAGDIRVRVLLFASFREMVGAGEVTVTMRPGSSAEAVFCRLADDCPEMARLRPATTFAVNREVTAPETQLHDGDELAFLQPVSGGSDA